MNIGFFLAKKLIACGDVVAALTSRIEIHNMLLAQKEVPYEYIVNYDWITTNLEE